MLRCGEPADRAIPELRLRVFACPRGMWNARSQVGCRGVWMATTNANLDSFGDRGPLLRWLVFTGLWVFAFVLLWRFGAIRQMVGRARPSLSSIIRLLLVAASLPLLWRPPLILRAGGAARRGGDVVVA